MPTTRRSGAAPLVRDYFHAAALAGLPFARVRRWLASREINDPVAIPRTSAGAAEIRTDDLHAVPLLAQNITRATSGLVLTIGVVITHRCTGRDGGGGVTYVIAEPCVDVMDRACVEECPVDCIYVGGRSLYINPDECVDCGACEPVCPVEAIFYEDDLPQRWGVYAEDNARFFTDTLAGRQAPLGDPGGAAKVGDLGVDTELVASLPPAARAGAS